MKSSHLTDETLQAFLLKEIQDETVAAHLTGCSACSERLEEYQTLINRVQQVEAEAFSFDVSALAMQSVLLYEKKKSKKQELVFWGLLIVLVIAIASFSVPFIPAVLALFSLTADFSILLITGTGAVVLLFLLADIVRQYKAKEEKLFATNLQPLS
jgi:predicted tellurium resistance membrane protein TerC